MHKMEDIFEPQELEQNLLTEFDQQIRIEDKPERFMLRSVPVTTEPNDYELEKEAEWIYNQAFQAKKPISNQYIEPAKPMSTINKIKDTLNFIRNEFLEVPFIASYRKEYIDPELEINDLWKIYQFDEKYCQLKQRKENLLKLFERTQKYQLEEQIPDLKSRQSKKLNDFEDIEQIDESIVNQLNSIRLITDDDLNRVRSIPTVEEFLDYYHFFHLHYSTDLISMKEFEFKLKLKTSDEIDADLIESAKYMKYASRKDKLSHCKQAGLYSLSQKYGLTNEQFAENLKCDYQRNELEQYSIEPSQLALDYIKEPYFQTVEQVLTTVQYMLAVQMARDPQIRQIVRDLYQLNSCLTVKPTQRGLKEIDESHLCFKFKYLTQKPCYTLKEDEFLKLIIAEQDQLLTIKFETLPIKYYQPVIVDPVDMEQTAVVNTNDDDWDDGTTTQTTQKIVKQTAATTSYTTHTKTIVEKLKSFYQKDEFSYNVEQWNQQRAQIIDQMCQQFLFPDFEKELRAKLIQEAKYFVFNECKQRLSSLLNQLPLQGSTGLDQAKSGHIDYNEHGLNVLSITFTTNEMDETGGSSLATVAVASFINGAGDLDEYIRIRHFNLKLNQTREYLNNQREEKLEDLNKLEQFILTKQPQIIAINNENKDSLIIQEDIRYIIDKISQTTRLNTMRIEIIDNEIAKLLASNKDIEQPGLVRLGINLAHYIQDPLLCTAQLCNQNRDILALKLHPMQQSLITMSGGRQSDDSTQLIQLIEIEFINRVNEVGVDLNRCNQCPHTAHVLQFVAGLGKFEFIFRRLRL